MDVFHQLRGVAAQQIPGWRECDMPRCAVDQRYAKFGLELAHRLRNGGLRLADALGGTGEAAGFTNRQKRFNVVEIHRSILH